MAHLAGVSTRTVDYYTQIGVIKEKERTNGNHRLYSEDALTSIKVVKQLQEQHFSLDEISLMFKNNDNNNLMEKTVCIKALLDNLQKKVVEFYLCQNSIDQPEENKVVLREIVTKGLNVMQILMVLLGEHMT
ncbi:mercuric resistance operon regulatory protein [Clostridium magnum DSM 2767]|uniref:Mercuric resistance operon regulatory protein n=1 Tax=Clostridium magnum DSM 2767 TaxID=1121326 RepID=A0A162RPV4_9CLOT|nr:mercuric resistance operon regulatory protein [Clostridium magnum DSM 2767]SHI14190.1 MerR HTH family regulatory protein [Clostridium magnum DSM 2767]